VAIVAEGPRWQLCYRPLLKRQRPLAQLKNIIRRTRLETPGIALGQFVITQPAVIFFSAAYLVAEPP
jgi:hypothetical protein